MTPQAYNDRRKQQPLRHSLVVHAVGGELAVRCRCGQVIAGRRAGDTRHVSLVDLLELVRLHHGNA